MRPSNDLTGVRTEHVEIPVLPDRASVEVVSPMTELSCTQARVAGMRIPIIRYERGPIGAAYRAQRTRSAAPGGSVRRGCRFPIRLRGS